MPSPGLQQSAFFFALSLSLYLSLLPMYWRIATASATVTFSSRFASPYRMLSGVSVLLLLTVVVYMVDVDEVVFSVEVVVGLVSVADVVVVVFIVVVVVALGAVVVVEPGSTFMGVPLPFLPPSRLLPSVEAYLV